MWLAVFIMPRLEGVSATTTLCPIRRNPRPRAELRMLASCPAKLLINVTLMDWSAMASTHDLFDALAALGRNVVGSAELAERIHGGAHHVDGVARSVALGEYVAYARTLEHRAHSAAGDHAGTVRGRLHVHPGGSMPSFDSVEQGIVLQGYVHQALSGLHHRLGDRDRHFARLAVAKYDPARAVADDGERGEPELLAALDDFRNAIHGDQLLEQVVAGHGFFCSRLSSSGTSVKT